MQTLIKIYLNVNKIRKTDIERDRQLAYKGIIFEEFCHAILVIPLYLMRLLINIGKFITKLYEGDLVKMCLKSAIDKYNSDARNFFLWSDQLYDELRMDGWRGHEQTEYNQKYRALSIKQVLKFKAIIKAGSIGFPICMANVVLNFEIDENMTPEQKLKKNTYEY